MEYSDEKIRSLPHNELVELFIQMKDEFDEYQVSSSEIEKMQDAEIEDLKIQLRKAENRVHQLSTDQERSKDRLEESRTQWVQVEEQLRRENAQLKEQNAQYREKTRKLEQRNDVLETSERNKEFMASDLGTKLDNAIEKIAMLESELHERQTAAEEMHRLKEELRNTERPRLVVEPMRNEIEPDEPSPGTSKENLATSSEDIVMEDIEEKQTHEDVHMEETVTRMDDIRIDDNKNIEEKNRSVASGARSCVNSIVKDLMSKVERLETLLSTIKLTSSSNNNNMRTIRT